MKPLGCWAILATLLTMLSLEYSEKTKSKHHWHPKFAPLEAKVYRVYSVEDVDQVVPDISPYYKILSQDPIAESIKLIQTLSNMILKCPTCSSKLKSQLNENAGVTSSSQHNNVDTTTQTRKLYHYEYSERPK